jgi:hypothetical protein
MGRDDTGGIDEHFGERLQAQGIRLGERQWARLQWLSRAFGPLTLANRDVASGGGRTIVVVDPPSGAGAELFCSSLTANDAVVIPFGENPAFDFMKAKLTEFGTIGASADGPHELWWGGLDWRATDQASRQDPLIVSCYPKELGDLHVYHLRRSLDRLGLASEIEAVETSQHRRLTAADKADFIQRMWRRHSSPLLFVESDVILQAVPDLPVLADCDFAVHKWNGWEMSARVLYFGRSRAAETMLKTWQEIASSYPDVWDGYLIDQAWSLTSSQMPLDTIWLPRSYHAVAGRGETAPAMIVHNLRPTSADLGPDPEFAEMVRSARRAGRAGARDSLLVVHSEARSAKAVMVILRDFEGSSARAIAARVDALTSAFAADCGGFSRLELTLCPWQEDVRIAREAAYLANNEVIEVVPSQELPPDLFRAVAAREMTRPPTNIETYRR